MTVRRTHPNRAFPVSANAMFVKLQQAFEILSDPAVKVSDLIHLFVEYQF